MAEHLSDLALDELSLNEGTLAAHSHVAGCPRCAAEVKRLRASNDVGSHRAFERTWRAALASRPARKRLGLRWAAGVGLAAAATLAWVVFAPVANEPTFRTKGTGRSTARLEVRDALSEPVGSVKEGQRVSVALTGVSTPFAALVTVDAHGAVSTVWPAGGSAERLPRGGEVPAALEVTAGSVALMALFSPQPFDVEDAATRVRLRLDLPPGVEVARGHLDVEAAP